jgi:hypothetical protein
MASSRSVSASTWAAGTPAAAPASTRTSRQRGLLKREGPTNLVSSASLLRAALPQDGDGDDGQAGEQLAAAGGGEEEVLLAVVDVEFHEVVGEAVVEAGVLGEQPLAVEDVALAEGEVEVLGVGVGPLLEAVEVALAGAAGEVVAARLEEELAVGVEAEAGVGAVHLLLDDEVLALDVLEGDGLEVVVAVLEAGALDVAGARVFLEDRLQARHGFVLRCELRILALDGGVVAGSRRELTRGRGSQARVSGGARVRGGQGGLTGAGAAARVPRRALS